MKKISVVLLILVISVLLPVAYPANADDTERKVYALIGNDCQLYHEDTLESVKFLLPETYFVEVLEEGDTFLHVEYLKNITGYVDISKASVVSYIPVSIFPTTGKVTVDSDTGVAIKLAPTKVADTISVAPDSTELVLIGEANGEERVSGYGTLWYFVSYGDKTGYVYSAYAEVTEEMLDNVIAAVPEPNDNLKDIDLPESNVTPKAEIIIIAALILPALFIVWTLFRARQPKSARGEKDAQRKQPKYGK